MGIVYIQFLNLYPGTNPTEPDPTKRYPDPKRKLYPDPHRREFSGREGGSGQHPTLVRDRKEKLEDKLSYSICMSGCMWTVEIVAERR